jgi:hypothetical protein
MMSLMRPCGCWTHQQQPQPLLLQRQKQPHVQRYRQQVLLLLHPQTPHGLAAAAPAQDGSKAHMPAKVLAGQMQLAAVGRCGSGVRAQHLQGPLVLVATACCFTPTGCSLQQTSGQLGPSHVTGMLLPLLLLLLATSLQQQLLQETQQQQQQQEEACLGLQVLLPGW